MPCLATIRGAAFVYAVRPLIAMPESQASSLIAGSIRRNINSGIMLALIFIRLGERTTNKKTPPGAMLLRNFLPDIPDL